MRTAGNIVAMALACGSLAAAPFLRIGSGPLNASVQNERDAALDRATAWLVAHQSPEGFWGNSNVVATAVAALAIRGDRETLPPQDSNAVQKAISWLCSSACTNAIATSIQAKDFNILSNSLRARAWHHLALTVLCPAPSATNNIYGVARYGSILHHNTFDAMASAELAENLAILLKGKFAGHPRAPVQDPAGLFIAAASSDPPSSEVRNFAERLARVWSDGEPGVWLDNPEAAWWLARSINRATGGNLTLPPDANGNVVDVNWRGIMAGKWINSQRIDDIGNGHWDGDAEKTAFAALLLNEM